ncbi:MAG: Mur ligase family protein [Elusimicrobiales bacterium]|nr:Mur ligase family protein [Elusimicrobiales bacterium]
MEETYLRFKEIEKILYTKHSQIKKNGITHILEILNKMGNPHKKIGKVIHITGTNGKGSVSYLTASFLSSLGYKVGLYTSPHINSLTERIKINLQDISYSEFVRLYEYVVSFDSNLSFFEIVTLIMIKYFEENNLDFSVVEVGIGGLYDTTNVLDGELCFITSIDYDHMDMLGPTLNDIAFQKAGIIKNNSMCVVGDIANEQLEVIKKVALSKKAIVLKVENLFEIIGLNEKWQMVIKDKMTSEIFSMPIVGIKQTLNLSMVILGLSKIGLEINNNLIKLALSKLRFDGRFQIIETRLKNKVKLFIVDGAHNPAAIKSFLENIVFFGFDKKNPSLVFSMLSTKDYITSIKNISDKDIFKNIIITSINNPKKLSPFIIAETFSKFSSNTDITVIDELKHAINYATNFSDVVCILGSFYLVSDALKVLREDL